MKKVIILMITIIFSFCAKANGQNILQEFSNKFFLIEENQLKKFVFVNEESDSTIVLFEENLQKSTGLFNHASVISNIIDVKSSENLVGVMYVKRSSVFYVLYDISSNERALVNGKRLQTIQSMRMPDELSMGIFTMITPNYLLERIENAPELSKIHWFSSEGYHQVFDAVDSPQPNQLI